MAAYTTLVDTATLAAHLDDPAWTIVDCRFKLGAPAWGEHEHATGHIPRAVYAHLERDLSGAPNGVNGRHPLPDPDALVATFSQLGIDSGQQVVAYDHDNAMYAGRLWWLLRWLGHRALAVLDGGFAKWVAEERPVVPGVETALPRAFSGTSNPAMVADVSEVAARRLDAAWRLIDARAPERFRGEIEPIDRVPGHIPGAVNLPYQGNVDERGVFRPESEIRSRLQESMAGRPADHTICYCGSGVTACQNLLALEHVGLTGAKLYPGSWSEWASDGSRPTATGTGTETETGKPSEL